MRNACWQPSSMPDSQMLYAEMDLIIDQQWLSLVF